MDLVNARTVSCTNRDELSGDYRFCFHQAARCIEDGELGLRHTVHGSWGLPFAVVRWVAAIALLGLAFGLVVRLAPAERRATKWATGGATVVVVAWLVESLIFRWYVTSVANFKTAPGSLAVFLVIMTYFYVGAIILLVGIELDELLRKDVQGEDRAIHEIVRGLL